jgi:hypothetical protein
MTSTEHHPTPAVTRTAGVCRAPGRSPCMLDGLDTVASSCVMHMEQA